jgi:hypothetical protein
MANKIHFLSGMNNTSRHLILKEENLNNFIESILIIIFYIKKLIKYVLFDFWNNLFSRLYICPLKGHNWYFVGGGWIFSSNKSFLCKRCGKYSDHTDKH